MTKPVVSIHSETYKRKPNPIPGSVTQHPLDQFHGTENGGVALSVLGTRKDCVLDFRAARRPQIVHHLSAAVVSIVVFLLGRTQYNLVHTCVNNTSYDVHILVRCTVYMYNVHGTLYKYTVRCTMYIV